MYFILTFNIVILGCSYLEKIMTSSALKVAHKMRLEILNIVAIDAQTAN